MRSRQVGLIFHGIGIPGRELEPGEAPYWITRDQYARILDRIMALPDPEVIRISFDDGNRSDLEIGLPLLQERGLRADFFVLAARIGRAGSLSESQVRSLRDAGMGVGSHGIDHVYWPDLESDALSRELRVSRQAIEAITGRTVDTAAIPFGAYNARVLRGLCDAGYKTVYSSDQGLMTQNSFLSPRTSVRSDMDDTKLSDILAGRMSTGVRLRRAFAMARRRWL